MTGATGVKRPLAICVTGPPGVGKSTLTTALGLRLNVCTFDTGKVLRRIARASKDVAMSEEVAQLLAAGRTIPVDLFCMIIRDSIGVSAQQGLIIDGYPRSVEQARSLQDVLAAIDLAAGRVVGLMLRAPADLALNRTTARYVCTACYSSIEHGIRCCADMRAVRRNDDENSFSRERYDSFQREAKNISAEFRARWPMYEIDTDCPADQTISDAMRALRKSAPLAQ